MKEPKQKSGKKNHISYSKKKNKVPRNKPNQGRKGLYSGNYTTLKEIQEDTNKWKHVPCSWIRRTNIIKMCTLSSATYTFSAIPVKAAMTYFTDIDTHFKNLYGNHK